MIKYNPTDIIDQVERMFVWSYNFCQICFVWSLTMAFAVMRNVTSHIGVPYVSNLAIMLENTGCIHSHRQQCRRLYISSAVGVTQNWWCTGICGLIKQREPGKMMIKNKTLLDETAIFMATHLQDIVYWQFLYCLILFSGHFTFQSCIPIIQFCKLCGCGYVFVRVCVCVCVCVCVFCGP